MESLEGKVKIKPVAVTIHWPTVACGLCGGDIVTLQEKPPLYQCTSCEEITEGRTQVIEAIPHPVNAAGAEWLRRQQHQHDSRSN